MVISTEENLQMKTRFSEEQIIGILREAGRPNASAKVVSPRDPCILLGR